ncbi:HypC/HybG/HupF family hydrogenase formation chaperone [Desulfuromonas sp. AOP6]|uniref:HypC/HybG/HupF family hydrogenase formation chaperone n=1 Tax=Desulfuromonas sp. AOP6 TaxID=1566351 RepID=UPI00127FFF35|nr:HypC/HybG/HupF family hydrogenase formation chaperone [Desulfuromonas sp. AOP6]BCA79364.1 hydrogenase assembly protein HypC [Desulfuromonas sp. AOP6]
MCLGVPMRIVTIDGDVARCEVDGVERDASLMMIEDVAIGDFVLIHAGFAIARLDPAQAEETLAAFRAVLDQGEGPT